MSSAKNEGRLSTSAWDRVHSHAGRFEQACKVGDPADLAQFLPPPGDPLRPECLHELIKIDLEIRWRRGRPAVLEDYLEQFPELRPASALPASLIYEEYLVRHSRGDRPPLATYQTRFPEQYEAVVGMVGELALPTNRPSTPTPPSGPAAALPIPVVIPASAGGSAVIGGMSLSEGTVLPFGGGYTFVKRIGIGGFGEVWKALAPGGVLAALKIISRPIDHEAAKHELESLELIKGLRHHFLLTTHAFWALQDRLVIAMDLADGSLRDRLKQCKREGKPGLPLPELLLYCRETAEALDYLHDKGVLHRDVKPENILLAEGHVRLADFGLARVFESRRATASGSGTPLYMPPEFWKERVSLHSDQYSFAVTYAELRLGRRLYETRGLAGLMNAHLQETPDLAPLTPAEQAVLLRALEKDPERRFPTCVAFVNALVHALQPELSGPERETGGPTTAGPPQPGEASWTADTSWETIRPKGSGPRPRLSGSHTEVPLPPWRAPTGGRGRALTAGLLLLVAAGLGIAAWRLWPGPTPENNPKKVEVGSTLPAGGPLGEFQPAGEETQTVQGRDYYKKIDYVLKDGPKVHFLLIYSKTDREQTAPFYLMRDKVTNELYAAFAKVHPKAQPNWVLGGRAERKVPLLADDPPVPFGHSLVDANPLSPARWASTLCYRLKRKGPNDAVAEDRLDGPEYLPHPDDIGVRNGQLPVLRVGIADAHHCARWLGGLLPSKDEWDLAAGAKEENRREGPYESGWKPGDDGIAIGRRFLGPLPVGEAAKDRSPYGCTDMSGNGLEWTRSYSVGLRGWQTLGGEALPTRDTEKIRFALRGRSYADRTPLKFEDQVAEGRTQPLEPGRPGWRPGWEVGFRVVVWPKP